MAEERQLELRADVKALLSAISPQADGLGVDDATLKTASSDFTALPQAEREDVAAQLVTVGVELERQGAKGIELMLAQLILLVRDLVGSLAKAGDMFAKARAAPAPAEKIELPPPADPSKLWK